MYIRSYDAIKNYYRGKRIATNALMKKYGRIPEEVAKYVEQEDIEFKKQCREFYRLVNKYHTDPYSVPVFNNEKSWRSVSTDDGETRTDFIIIPDNGQTDEDIEEFIFTTVGHKSYHDFSTGQLVTLRYYVERIPLGIKIIHECGIDW